MPDYGISVTLAAPYDETLARTRAALSEQGFGVLTEIDVRATMKAKLDVDLEPQIILGACNPPLAYRGLSSEASLGLLLPCNVVVRAVDDEHTVVEAVDPDMLVRVTGNEDLQEVAADVRKLLEAALHGMVES